MSINVAQPLKKAGVHYVGKMQQVKVYG